MTRKTELTIMRQFKLHINSIECNIDGLINLMKQATSNPLEKYQFEIKGKHYHFTAPNYPCDEEWNKSNAMIRRSIRLAVSDYLKCATQIPSKKRDQNACFNRMKRWSGIEVILDQYVRPFITKATGKVFEVDPAAEDYVAPRKEDMTIEELLIDDEIFNKVSYPILLWSYYKSDMPYLKAETTKYIMESDACFLTLNRSLVLVGK